MKRALLLAALAALLAGAAAAQVTFRPLQRPPAGAVAQEAQPSDPGAAQVGDPVLNLQNRLRALTNRVNALQSRVSELEAAQARDVSFECADGDTSRASNGVTEECRPYACDGQIGRCRKIAATSADCSSGFSWCVLYNSCTTAAQCQ